MTIVYKTSARSICCRYRTMKSSVVSDGTGGPDDGANHVHPEDVFHQDLHSRGFPGLHLR